MQYEIGLLHTGVVSYSFLTKHVPHKLLDVGNLEMEGRKRLPVNFADFSAFFSAFEGFSAGKVKN